MDHTDNVNGLIGRGWIIRTIDCTGGYYIDVKEDDIPRLKYIPLQGEHKVATKRLMGWRLMCVMVDGKWYDFSWKRSKYDEI